jgi:hypothetical protein
MERTQVSTEGDRVLQRIPLATIARNEKKDAPVLPQASTGASEDEVI